MLWQQVSFSVWSIWSIFFSLFIFTHAHMYMRACAHTHTHTDAKAPTLCDKVDLELWCCWGNSLYRLLQLCILDSVVVIVVPSFSCYWIQSQHLTSTSLTCILHTCPLSTMVTTIPSCSEGQTAMWGGQVNSVCCTCGLCTFAVICGFAPARLATVRVCGRQVASLATVRVCGRQVASLATVRVCSRHVARLATVRVCSRQVASLATVRVCGHQVAMLDCSTSLFLFNCVPALC